MVKSISTKRIQAIVIALAMLFSVAAVYMGTDKASAVSYDKKFTKTFDHTQNYWYPKDNKKTKITMWYNSKNGYWKIRSTVPKVKYPDKYKKKWVKPNRARLDFYMPLKGGVEAWVAGVYKIYNSSDGKVTFSGKANGDKVSKKHPIKKVVFVDAEVSFYKL